MTRRVRFTPYLRTGVFVSALCAPSLAHAVDVPFAPPVPVVGTSGVVSRLDSADFDRDGDPDLLVASGGAAPLVFLRNLDGTGTGWSTVTVSPVLTDRRDVVAADVDGDGDPDIVSVSPSPGLVDWHENLDGLGSSWAPHTIAAFASNYLTVADIDRDGDLDVLPRDPGQPLRWYENAGISNWPLHTISTLAVLGKRLDIADIDRDGDPDVVADFGGATWFENTASGNVWTAHNVGAFGFALRSADVDRDGQVDLLTASGWYENSSLPSWPLHEFGSPVPMAEITPADVDGDGDVDVWGNEVDGSVRWYENLAGDALSWLRRTIAAAANATAVALVDLDTDGDLDSVSGVGLGPAQVVRHRNDTIHRNACFAPSQALFDFPQVARSILTADVDRDGDLDVLTSHQSSSLVFWHENEAGASAWTPHTASTIGVPSGSLAVGDLDRDGDVDVAGDFRQGSTNIGKHWLENQGDGSSFTPHTISTVTNLYGADLHVADIDGDGDPDVFEATVMGYTGSSRWFANGGDGTAWSSAITTGGNRAHLADFDRDGDLDVVAGSDLSIGSNPRLFWLQNADGAGTVWTFRLIAQPEDARPSAPADLDGDGHIDVISSQFVNQEWYRNFGSGTSWSGAAAIPGGGYKAQPRDLDKDGDVDLLRLHTSPPGTWRFGWNENLQGTALSWLPHTLAGTPGAASFTALAAADLDRDGDLDVITGEAAVRWHPNRGGQYALAAENTAPGTVQQGNIVSMLRVVATHLGRAGDGPLELARFGVLLEEAAGDPLTSGEANLLVESLRVYRDGGNGIFEPTDTLVASIGTLSLVAGVQDIPFVDGDLNVRVAFGTPQTFFLVVELTADAATQNPNRVRTTLLQLGPSASQAEHAAYDVALAPACPADVSSVVMVAVVPVELMRFTIE